MSQAGSLCRDLGTLYILVKRNKNQLCDYMTDEPARLAGMPGIRSLQVMNSLFNENGQCPPSVSSFFRLYLGSGEKTFSLCAARTIIFQTENLNYFIVCFTQCTLFFQNF